MKLYEADGGQTYSGLFLVAINPYAVIEGLYSSSAIESYRSRRRDENTPHVFAVAQAAWEALVTERESQAILVTYVAHSAPECLLERITEARAVPARRSTPRWSSATSPPSLPAHHLSYLPVEAMLRCLTIRRRSTLPLAAPTLPSNVRSLRRIRYSRLLATR